MPKLLQIDSCLGVGSTGKIAEGIAKIAIAQGWECHMVHGARYKGNTIQHAYQTTTKFGEYLHYIESLIFDRHGLGSRFATKKIIKKIKEIQPDIIQLHCIHGYYINYKYLFEFLNTTDIPVVWAQHDCWSFTGHCAHFYAPALNVICNKWQKLCYECPLKNSYPSSRFLDRSKSNYILKKELFTSVPNMTIVPVSYWLGKLVRKSFLKSAKIQTIYNGIDTNIFCIRSYDKRLLSKYNIHQADNYILGVASTWTISKGLNDFFRLSKNLAGGIKIVLVGLSTKQLKQLPQNIIGIKRTDNAEELSILYSNSLCFINLTYSDTLPTVNLEAQSCGAPVISYDTGGCSETIQDKITGHIVKQGDLATVQNLISDNFQLFRNNRFRANCRKFILNNFDKTRNFREYISLYTNLLETNKK